MGQRHRARLCGVAALAASVNGCGDDSSGSNPNASTSMTSSSGGAGTGTGATTATTNTNSTGTDTATGTESSSATTTGAGGSVQTTASSGSTSTATTGGGEAGAGGTPTGSCGDGTLDGNETCDDGNGEEGDGCSASCQVVCTDYDPEAVQGPTGNCYLWEADADATHPAALAFCETLDAHLVTVTSAAEQEFIANLTDFIWMGAADGLDNFDEGTADFTWVTGESFEYQNWGNTQPNNTPHDCRPEVGTGTCYEHCLLKEEEGWWNDVDCSFPNPFVCEWDAPGT